MSKVWRRRDRNCWVADYRDWQGRRCRVTAETREAAEQLLAEKTLEARQARPDVVADPDITLRDYAKGWLDKIRDDIEGATHENYTQHLKNHLLPKLGHIRVRDLHRGHVKAFITEQKRRGYLKNTIRLQKATLSSLLTDAMDDGIVTANAAQGLSRKRNRQNRITQAEQQEKIRPMSERQPGVFLGVADCEPRYSTFFAVCALAGLRPGEARALSPGDIDLDNRKLRVERSLWKNRLKRTKTSERREVDLCRDLIRRLQLHLTFLKKDALSRGDNNPHWLFTNSRGHPLDPKKITTAMNRFLKKGKLPRFSQYDLRHTYASLLLSKCAPITYVSDQMGHANPTTTLKYYAHWIPADGAKRFCELLDDKVTVSEEPIASEAEKTWHQRLAPNGVYEDATPQAIDSNGAPGVTRTRDLLIRRESHEFRVIPQ